MNDESVDIDLVNQIKASIEDNKLDFEQANSFKLGVLRVEFTIAALRDEALQIFGHSVSEIELEKLQENAEYNDSRNVWSLLDNVRGEALLQLSINEISDLLRKMDFAGADWRQLLLNRMLLNKVPDSGYLEPGEYVQAYTYSKWIRHPSINIPSTQQLLSLIRRENLLHPFRKLTVNFSGREEYLSLVRKFVTEPARIDPDGREKFLLFIRGVGGVGKSTVISKFILDEAGGQPGIPFGYIDFDNAGGSASDVYALIKEVLTQLCLQNPAHEARFNEIIKVINSQSNSNRPVTKTGSRSSDRSAFYMDFLKIGELVILKNLRIPVLIVFDSFEELQYRSTPSEINTLFQFLTEIKELIPSLKIIFVGRADIIDRRRQDAGIPELEAFDMSPAVTYLQAMQIADEDLCRMLYTNFGGNPLTLQLAAHLILREIPKEEISLAEVNRRGLFAEIDKHLIQQQLVARNLDHIHDKDVAAIAVPGILVRKINAEVIKDILAEVCGLGKITTERSEEIFAELQQESFLLKQDGNDIQFRKDLRVSLYDLIVKEPKYHAYQIHNAAVSYYEKRDSPSDKAEYIFHRLKRGDNTDFLDKIYKPEMKPFLETALSELTDDAREQLALVMGLETSDLKLEAVSQLRWELYLLAQMQNVLEFGDEKQLQEVSDRLRGRTERSGSAEFTYHEQFVYTRLGESGRFEEDTSFLHLPNSDSGTALIQFALLKSYRYELQLNFAEALEELDKDASLSDKLKPDVKDLRIIIEYYCSKARLSRRLGKEFKNDRLLSRIDTLFSRLDNTSFSTIEEILLLFPKLYQLPMRKYYAVEYPNADTNAPVLANRQRNMIMLKDMVLFCLRGIVNNDFFTTSQQFRENYTGVKAVIGDKVELERFSRINNGSRLSDFTYPGVLQVLLFDFVLFSEAMNEKGKDWRINTEKIRVADDFKDKRHVAGVQEFINTTGVRTCVERLNREFSTGGGRKFIVSDIVDEEGHQYVNVIQRSNGIHHIALLGYLYILEKMGIRFLKSGGVKTGAINAALIGAVESKKDENVGKALETILMLDYFNLVDASPGFLRWLIKYFSPGRGLKLRIKLLLAITVILLGSVTAFWYTNLPETNPGNIISYAIALVSVFVTLSLVIFYFRFKRHVLRFGKGLNPGRFIADYFGHMFGSRNIKSISDFEEKARQTPVLITRKGQQFNSSLLSGDIAFVCADVITQKRIVFPAMSSLFWDRQMQKTINPGIFLRAAVSTPLFFDAVIIENIAGDKVEIKEAWLKNFNEHDPPTAACLVDAGPFSVFPFDIFDSAIYDGGPVAPLPTFAADTLFANEKLKIKTIKDLTWGEYLSRLINSAPYNTDAGRANQDKHLEKGMCKIKVSNIAAMNFFCSDRDKIQLFAMGAEAATEFLLKFDWEDYKRGTDIGSTLQY